MAGLSDTLNHRGSNVVQIYPKYPVLHRNKPKSYPQQDPCCSINYGMSSPNFTPCFGSLFPDAENKVNIYIVYQYFNFLTFSALSPQCPRNFWCD